MRIDSLLSSFITPVMLLTEANLYNLDTKYNGISLASFLAPHLQNVSEATRKSLQKKLAKLIINDEKLHKPMTKVPNDAPDWARAAAEQGQLVYFTPTVELDGQIEHITHYVAALETDQNGDDPNKKAVAIRELGGVAKAETLSLLIQKSNEYFARGSKRAMGSIEGTTHIFDGANGYSWYRLDTLDAYKREGKILQNCIGTHWTPSRADRVYVMKGSNGDTNVAVRTDTNNEIQEAKGKNNKPPVARYMPAVAELINHMKWKVSQYGMSDITNAGYVFVDGVLYSRSDAIEKFLKSTAIIKGNDYTIEKISSDVKLDPAVMRFLVGLPSYYGNNSRIPTTYTYKQGSDTLLTACVDNAMLTKLSLTSSEVANDKVNGPVAVMMRKLMESGIITDTYSDVREWLRKKAGIAVNFQTKEVGPITTMKDVPGHDQTGRVTTLQGDEATKLGKVIQDWMDDANLPPEWTQNIKEAHINVLDGDFTRGHADERQRFYPVQVGVVDKNDKVHFFTVNVSRDTHEVAIDGAEFGKRYDPAQSWRRMADEKSVNKWIEIANQKGFELPITFRLNNGILLTNGKYDTVHLSELRSATENGAQVFDVSKYKDVERIIALSTVTRTVGSGSMSLYAKFTALAFPTDIQAPGGSGFMRDRPREVSPNAVEQFSQEVFGSDVPDKVIKAKLDVADENVNVLLFVTGNEVVRINDDSSTTHTATDSLVHEALATALNTLTTSLGLKFRPESMSRHELSLIDDKVVTAHSVLADKLEKENLKNPSKPVRFEDGTVIKRMPTRDAIDTVALSNHNALEKNAPVTKVYEIERDGQTIGIFQVDHRGVAAALRGWDKKKYKKEPPPPPKSRLLSRRQLPHMMTRDTELVKYIIAAGKKLGFTWPVGGNGMAKPDSTPVKMLRVLAKETGPIPRSAVTKKAGSNPAGMSGWESSHVPADRKLYDAGYIDMEKIGRSYMLSINKKGRDALAALTPGRHLSLNHSFADVPILPDDVEYKKPEPAAPAAPQPSERRPAAVAPAGTATDLGNGSKADRAQRLWDQMVAATGVPARATFIQALINRVGMTPAGAGTYHANIKSKYMRQQGALGEHFSFVDFLFLVD